MNPIQERLRPRLLGVATLGLTLTLIPQGAPAKAAELPAARTVVDGRPLTYDVSPVIQDGRTLIPLRGFLTALGATVEWDQTTRMTTATLGSTVIKAQVGNPWALVNGREIPMDIPPQVIGDRTMIPLRFFTDNLGLPVEWDNTTRTASVDTRQLAETLAAAATATRDGSTTNRAGATMAATARELVGTRYAWGGTSPATGFDCSGFVTYVTGQSGLSLPRTSYEMFGSGIEIAKADLQAGDLVFFATYQAGASHVGVYDGQGNFIHSQSEETGVKATPLSSSYWAERYVGARRVTNR